MNFCGPTLFRVILKEKNEKRLIAGIAMQNAQRKFDADLKKKIVLTEKKTCF